MHFHPDKCTVVSVTQKRKTISHRYRLHEHTLEKVDSAKYLGITIQNNLKWDKHINTMTAKANQSLGFIKRNLKVHSPAIKERAFKVLVRPKLEYCNTIWDPHTQLQKLQIEKIQRRAARYVSNRYHNTSSVTYMMSDLNWAPPDTQIQIHSGTYRHQKTDTNTHSYPGLSHFGINCLHHLPLQTQLTVSRA
jgi:hypothetical protein